MSRLAEILALPKVTHNLVQGSDAWHLFRSQHRGASEAAAAMGLSKKVKRSELLHAKHTGLPREFSQFVQERILDRGHEVEAMARPHVEKLPVVADDLYPVTCSRGHLSASCDGLTMDDRIAFEHKQWAEDLATMVAAGVVPDEHMPQCQQILLVTGAEKVIFTVSDGTPENMVWAEVTPDHGWWERIVATWDHFDADLATYTPPAAEAPKPTGRAPESLPALRIEISGAVTASNLAEFKETALGAIRSVNRELTTDEHFADAEQAVKWCGEVESRIKAAKEHALSQTASIDALFRTLDDVSAEARRVRLDLEKLVERRKTEIKGELVAEAKGKYERHIEALRQECGAWRMLPPPDFGAAIKGKRNVASIRDALETTLANAKIVADDAARTIRAALAALDEESKGHEFLFSDRLTFIGMIPEAVRLMARDRIAKHQEAEQRRAAELAERERARSRAEEEARARAQAQREQQEREAAERRQRAEAEEAERQQRHARNVAMAREIGEMAKRAGDPLPENVRPLPTRAPAPQAAPTLKLGEINDRLKHISVTAEDLRALGFEPAGRDRSAVLFHDGDFPAIVDAIVDHLTDVREQFATKEAA